MDAWYDHGSESTLLVLLRTMIYRTIKSYRKEGITVVTTHPGQGLSKKPRQRPSGRTTPPQKTARIETRATTDQRQLIQEAARLSGCSVTDFVLRSAESAAEQAIKEYRIIQVSQRDTIAFLEALANPQPLDEKMQEAARWHRDNVEVTW